MKNTIIIFLISTLFCSFLSCNEHTINREYTEFIVDFDYWEGCETGKGECQPLNFERKLKTDSILLIMPCGGTFTEVLLTKYDNNELIRKVNVDHENCPPAFDLTGLEDGKYIAHMFACGLGGPITFNLMTKSE